MAAFHRIFFIEEPVVDEWGRETWEFSEPAAGVTVCRPHTPCTDRGFQDHQTPHLTRLLRDLLQFYGIEDFILWFYTPLALPATEEMRPRAIVYDCMDELSAFLGAPPELIQREKELISKADLIFTGGPSLYRSKKDRHPHVYCLPSSVDAPHFAAANGTAEAADQMDLPHPRFGYYGVIDERMDLPLIAALADSHPEWQIVMVGPVVKIDSATLPSNPNIRYYGQRAYAELPSYLKGWDVCIMPFARNRSTEFISPTKTLEYMAAGKMIVSTPITDVADPYGDVVYLGGTHSEFATACEQALCVTREERGRRHARMLGVLSQTSWTSTVQRMHELMTAAIEARASVALEGRDKSKSEKVDTLVIGAGPTGLSAAYHLGEQAILLEQNSEVGGWCRSIHVNGFTFDYAGHIMFSSDPYVHQLYAMLLGDNVHWQDREAWIYSKDVFTRYPFQASLYGLPPDVITECIVGAIESRYGSLKASQEAKSEAVKTSGHLNGYANGHTNGICAAKTGDVKDCCADGILEASAPLVVKQQSNSGVSAEPRNFEEFIYKVWGAGIGKHFAIPYNRKLWAVPLNEMETSWLGGRVPLPNLQEMIEGALMPAPKPMGPNARFGYPLRGGFQSLMAAWLPHLKGLLRTGCAVVEVSPSRHTLTLSDGSRLRYEHLISTMPLPVLIRQMGEEAPEHIRAAGASLRYVSVRCVHLGIGRENVTDKHWIYYPEDTVFHRIFVQGNASPHCNPPGGFGLTCEITYSRYKPLPYDGDALIQRCIDDCRRVGIIASDDPVLATAQCDLPHAYVVYDHGRAAAVLQIREWLERHDIILAGRYSEWEYYNSDHAFLAGKKAADRVTALKRSADQLSITESPGFISSAPSAAPVM